LNALDRRCGIFIFVLSHQLARLTLSHVPNGRDEMRKTILAATAMLATALALGYASAATETFKGTLSGASEVPPVTSKGAGTASVNLDTATKQVTYNVTYTGLTEPAAAAHIHCGAAAGANSGVAVPFANAASPITGSATLTDAQMADLQAGKCYVNVHTATNKGGELRAQLAK
jgi:hypothetical protein